MYIVDFYSWHLELLTVIYIAIYLSMGWRILIGGYEVEDSDITFALCIQISPQNEQTIAQPRAALPVYRRTI